MAETENKIITYKEASEIYRNLNLAKERLRKMEDNGSKDFFLIGIILKECHVSIRQQPSKIFEKVKTQKKYDPSHF